LPLNPPETKSPSELLSPAADSTFSNNSDEDLQSSKSSIDPPTDDTSPEKKFKMPPVDHELLKERLQAKIDALRTARKADGLDGRPARSRSELIEARRKKQETRKEHKKELRRQAKEDEVKAKAEAELARMRGSGSPLTGSDIFGPASPDNVTTSFSFGRITFEDGQQFDVHGNLIQKPKGKGPSDPRTALQAAANKQARLNGLDEDKRNDIESKDLWLNAKKKVHGERVRDDVSLLKKALKRKEKQKSRSEREWHEREETLQRSQEAKQRKREDNLSKRREEKGGKKAVNKMKKAKRKAFGGFGGKKTTKP
jgi:hypothetical protein